MVEKKVASAFNLIRPISAKQRKKIRNFDLFREKIFKKYKMNIPDNYEDALAKVIIFSSGFPDREPSVVWDISPSGDD